MSSRRGKGEGSIYQRASDGKWVGMVNLGYGPDGKRKRRPIYGKTRKDVTEKIKVLLREQQQGLLPMDAKRQTVAQYLNDWLENSVKQTVRPRTYASYRQLCTLYIIPSLGQIGLNQLAPQQIRAFLNYLSGRRVKRTDRIMSVRTVTYCHAILRRSLNQAVRLGLLARNPATMIDPPRSEKHEAQFLTVEQARALLMSVSNDRLGCLYTLALHSGLRQGELLGLTWDCVDLDIATLTVCKSLQRVDGRLQYVEPKSKSSRRTVQLTRVAIAALHTHRKRQLAERLLAGSGWQENNLVFPNTAGKPYDASNIINQFHKALERAGLPRIRFHELRHTCASLLLTQDVPMKVVQEILGHSDYYLTANTYSHVIPELKREAADRLDALFAYSE
jgi:integrase